MTVFILIIFLNATGAIESYTVGGAPSLDACRKTIEADKPNWNPELKGLPFCINTGTVSGLSAPAMPTTGAKKSLGTEI